MLFSAFYFIFQIVSKIISVKKGEWFKLLLMCVLRVFKKGVPPFLIVGSCFFDKE
jgi:hypothetical protein